MEDEKLILNISVFSDQGLLLDEKWTAVGESVFKGEYLLQLHVHPLWTHYSVVN